MINSSSPQPFPQKSSSGTPFFLINHQNSMCPETENEKKSKKKKKNEVFFEEEELCRSRSLTDDDLEELKGCLDLGFGFNYDEIPELCNTLPALELCYSMSQKFQDEQHKGINSVPDSSIPNWRISSPGDDPEDVKARLKYWAQAVACTVKLCI